MTTLDALRAIQDDEALVRATARELKRLRCLETDITNLRNEGIRRLGKTRTLAEIAEIADVAKSTIKWINGPRSMT
jgi:hypothetical protein